MSHRDERVPLGLSRVKTSLVGEVVGDGFDDAPDRAVGVSELVNGRGTDAADFGDVVRDLLCANVGVGEVADVRVVPTFQEISGQGRDFRPL